MDFIQSIDRGIITFATQLGGGSMLRDQIVYVLAEWIPYLMVLIAIILFFSGRTLARQRRNREAVVIGTVAWFLAVTVRLVLAGWFARPRPAATYPDIHHLDLPHLSTALFNLNAAQYAFPSGHAMATFSFAGLILFLGYRRVGWLLLVLAGINGLARVTAGVHYLTDILAGAALGLLIARLVSWQVGWVKRELK